MWVRQGLFLELAEQALGLAGLHQQPPELRRPQWSASRWLRTAGLGVPTSPQRPRDSRVESGCWTAAGRGPL